MALLILLSKLACSRSNVRRVRPALEAHRRMVASIRAYDLLEPLVVRRIDDTDRYEVIDGERRLAALRVVHRGHDPKIECTLKKVDSDTARAMSLSANFTQEHMHPLDEAEAFARLASVDCKGVAEIASDFGVSHSYIRQRMKLAELAGLIKDAYRHHKIDTATAEAFASVPPERQLQVWKEVGGKPENAGHVRAIICEQWIDAGRALFDLATVPPSAISSDLFAEKVLIERSAFMAAQSAALVVKQNALVEEGWSEVVIGDRASVQDRLYQMLAAEPSYDEATNVRLEQIASRRDELWESDKEDDEAMNALEQEEEDLLANAEASYDEATKANGTVFLLLEPGGQVHAEYRLPRSVSVAAGDQRAVLEAPTCDQLSERQLMATYTHEAIAVRQAVAGDSLTRKRLAVLALHPRVRHDALSVSHGPNETSQYAQRTEGFVSQKFDSLSQYRRAIDPFADAEVARIDEVEGYQRLEALKEAELDYLIEMLLVESLTGHLKRDTPLLTLLRSELGVNIRQHWRPDATWLAGYRKCQLAHLVEQLRGKAYGPSALKRKKSELVTELDGLFAAAATGTLEDPQLSERVNAWIPGQPSESGVLMTEV